MKITKLSSLLVASAMSLTLLAGCAPNKTANDKASTTTTSTTTVSQVKDEESTSDKEATDESSEKEAEKASSETAESSSEESTTKTSETEKKLQETSKPTEEKTEAKAETAKTPEKDVTIQVAAIETAYGSDVWKEVSESFTKKTGIKVDLITNKELENVIGAQMQGGEFPDVIHLAVSRKAALTEQFIKDRNILEITDLLSEKVVGEEKTLGEKIIPGFINDNSITNPYSDGKTYLAPTFYAPAGLFYNKGLFEEKGWKVPETWDDMWKLAEEAKKDDIALFTYPTTGYFDSLFYALVYEAGGPEFFHDVTHYAENVWDRKEAKQVLDIIAKLASYTNKITPAQANQQDFTQNQQLILDNKALFMPNGTWVVGEMSEATRADGFKWGFTALPALEKGGDQYSYTFFEQAWIPKEAKHPEEAKQFISYLYSDEAVEIFATKGKAPAVQPVLGVDKLLTGDNKLFYQIYENGAKAAIGNFANFKAAAGLPTVKEVFFEPLNDLVTGKLSQADWTKSIKDMNDKYRENLDTGK